MRQVQAEAKKRRWSLSLAVEEAVKAWLKSTKRKKPAPEEPTP